MLSQAILLAAFEANQASVVNISTRALVAADDTEAELESSEGLFSIPDLSIPELDIPKLEIPELDIPGLDIPQLEIPELAIPELEDLPFGYWLRDFLIDLSFGIAI